MNNSLREIRVFLSSTFRDMDGERGYLVKHVFPRVRAACQARQVGFTEIDLRWGVTEEESKNGATVEICLREIDRCRDFPPFFIGFLGERYGWIPREHELAAYWQRHADSPYAQSIRDAVARGISVTELEMELAVFGNPHAQPAYTQQDLGDRALFLLREPALSAALRVAANNARQADFFDEGGGRLAALKRRIRESGLLGVDGYASIEAFGQAIEDHLLGALDRYFPAGQVPTAQQRSEAAHAAFRFQRLQNFLPRTDVRHALSAAVLARVTRAAHGPILLSGPPGQGKSAVMADLARHLAAMPGEHRFLVIDHYVGADEYNAFDAWVTRVLERLHPEIASAVGLLPASSQERINCLASWAASMARHREQLRTSHGDGGAPVAEHVVLMIDGLEMLSGFAAAQLNALQAAAGPDCLLVLSVTDGTRAAGLASGLERIALPPLDATMRASVIRETLTRFRKALPEAEIARLANAPQGGSPLFLALALEELRVDAQHETLSGLVDQILSAADAEHLLLNNFLLDPDYSRPEQPGLAAQFMAFLGAARAGLTENELADLLAMPGDPVAGDTGLPRLPQKHLSRLFANFGEFLSNSAGRRMLMYRMFGKVAREHCGEAGIRQRLHAYFAPGFGQDHATLVTAAAAEALHQATNLARPSHKAALPQSDELVAGLSLLWVPAGLYGTHADVTRKALEALTPAERGRVGDAWVSLLRRASAEDISACAGRLSGFASWMRSNRYDRCHLARRLATALLEQQEATCADANDPAIASTLTVLGRICTSMSDFAPVRSLHERALAIREKSLGAGHDETAISLANLASHLQKTGTAEDFRAARPLLERALAIREALNGTDHPDTANSLSNLAVYLADSADPAGVDAARAMFERALAIKEKAYGPDSQQVANNLNNLAQYLRHTGDPGDFAAARALLVRALNIRENLLGPDHDDTATSLSNLAGYLQSTGDPASRELARKYHERALAIREKVFGPDSVETANSLNSLAEFLKSSGVPADRAAIRPLYERALAIWQSRAGAFHPDTGLGLNNLAMYLKASDDPGDRLAARHLLERALLISEKSFGGMHRDVARSLNNLARVLKETGDPADLARARGLLERALQIWEKTLGEDHPASVFSLNNLAECLQASGIAQDFRDARALFERALAIRQEALGPDHRDTAISLHNFAAYLLATGVDADLAAAVPLLERALAIRERVFGAEHVDTSRTRDALAAAIERRRKD